MRDINFWEKVIEETESCMKYRKDADSNVSFQLSSLTYFHYRHALCHPSLEYGKRVEKKFIQSKLNRSMNLRYYGGQVWSGGKERSDQFSSKTLLIIETGIFLQLVVSSQ